MTTNEKLKRLMKRYKLSSRNIAAMIGYTKEGVDRWLIDPDKPSCRHLKPVLLQTIKHVIKERETC